MQPPTPIMQPPTSDGGGGGEVQPSSLIRETTSDGGGSSVHGSGDGATSVCRPWSRAARQCMVSASPPRKGGNKKTKGSASSRPHGASGGPQQGRAYHGMNQEEPQQGGGGGLQQGGTYHGGGSYSYSVPVVPAGATAASPSVTPAEQQHDGTQYVDDAPRRWSTDATREGEPIRIRASQLQTRLDGAGPRGPAPAGATGEDQDPMYMADHWEHDRYVWWLTSGYGASSKTLPVRKSMVGREVRN